MTISEVDKKYLGRFASKFQNEHPLLAQSLFQILGIFTMLSGYVIKARNLRRLDATTTRNTKSAYLYIQIIWLAREGLKILEEYVLPMVVNYGELKTLSYKLKGSFYYLFVLFHNKPAIKFKQIPEKFLSLSEDFKKKEINKTSSYSNNNNNKNEEFITTEGTQKSLKKPMQSAASHETPAAGGLIDDANNDLKKKVSFIQFPEDIGETNFLIPIQDYRSTTRHCFQEATNLANQYLYGSHPIRLSLMVEYSTFIFECLNGWEESRQLAKKTVTEVFKAQEGIDNETFTDSIHLVNLLGNIVTRGFDEN